MGSVIPQYAVFTRAPKSHRLEGTMPHPPQIAVSALSFSKNEILVRELGQDFPNPRLNTTGRTLSEPELRDMLQGADAAIVGTEPITEALLAQLPQLKFLSKYGVGMDNIDLDACKKHTIAIGWTGGVNKTAVAEMTLAFMISLCRNLFLTSQQLKTGIWNKNGGVQLAGKTVGIIGAGDIGKELIRLLAPFQCRILINDVIDQSEYIASVGATAVPRDVLFRESDIVTIHTPLTPETHYLIATDTLALMKPTAFLINTARGSIVDINALNVALKNGVIAGAALDTYEHEPPTDFDLFQLPNLICTPHIGGNSVEAVLAMGRSAIGHLREYFNSISLST